MNIYCIRPKGLNIGNEAIFLAMKHFIHRAFGQVPNIITLPSTSVFESHRTAGLTSRTIHEINHYADGVIVGGGNLYENNNLDLDPLALAALEVPLFLFALSYGRVYNRFGQLVRRTDAMPDDRIRALNQKAQLSHVRDMATYSHLQSIGVTNVVCSGCPTLFLDKLDVDLNQFREVPEGLTLISVRHPALMSIPVHKQAQVYRDVQGIISWLLSLGHDVRILCHDYRDIPFACTFPEVDYIYTDDVYVYLALLQRCRLNVTYRLHSALPCLAFQKPFIQISYDERALSLVETIGYSDWNINMIHCSDVLAEVMNRYKRLHELEHLRERIAVRRDELYKLMLAGFERFAEYTEAFRRRNR